MCRNIDDMEEVCDYFRKLFRAARALTRFSGFQQNTRGALRPDVIVYSFACRPRSLRPNAETFPCRDLRVHRMLLHHRPPQPNELFNEQRYFRKKTRMMNRDFTSCTNRTGYYSRQQKSIENSIISMLPKISFA